MNLIQTYVTNQQVFASELNAIQRFAIGGAPGSANNALALMGAGFDIVSWEYNVADLIKAVPMQVDAKRSYRDCILLTTYNIPGGADQQPGGVSDYLFDYATALRVGYMGTGAREATGLVAPSAGFPPVPIMNTSWAMQIAASVWLYAHPTTGALWIYNDTAVSIRHPLLMILASAPTGARP